MFAPNWVARGEYRYTSYGTVSFVDTRTATAAGNTGLGFTVVGTPLAVSHGLKAQTQTATFGLSYLFGGGQ